MNISPASSINEMVRHPTKIISLDSASSITSKTSTEELLGIPHAIHLENKRSDQEMELNRI